MSEEKYYTHDLSLHQLGSFYCCWNLRETTKIHLSCLLATLRMGSLFQVNSPDQTKQSTSSVVTEILSGVKRYSIAG